MTANITIISTSKNLAISLLEMCESVARWQSLLTDQQMLLKTCYKIKICFHIKVSESDKERK